MARKELTGKKKAAILMVALGSKLSSNIMKHMDENNIEELTLEIANLQRVDTSVKEEVLYEFHQLCLAKDYISQGGINYARDLLEQALGSQKAEMILERLTASLQVRPFDSIRRTDPSQLFNFIQNEHPQTIALIMAYLTPEQSSIILSSLEPELQADVARRIAIMDQTSPDVIKDVERILEDKLSSFMTDDYTAAGGIESIVTVLNMVDRSTEKRILDDLGEVDPELADEIRKRLFVFEDIVILDDRTIQIILREISMDDLTLALKTSSEEVSEKIYKNMSKRASKMLKEDIEYLGPVRLREVEDAQQNIVNEIRRLEDAGEIVIARGGGEVVV